MSFSQQNPSKSRQLVPFTSSSRETSSRPTLRPPLTATAMDQSLRLLHDNYERYLQTLPAKQREYHQQLLMAAHQTSQHLRHLSAPLLLAKQQKQLISTQSLRPELNNSQSPPFRPEVTEQQSSQARVTCPHRECQQCVRESRLMQKTTAPPLELLSSPSLQRHNSVIVRPERSHAIPEMVPIFPQSPLPANLASLPVSVGVPLIHNLNQSKPVFRLHSYAPNIAPPTLPTLPITSLTVTPPTLPPIPPTEKVPPFRYNLDQSQDELTSFPLNLKKSSEKEKGSEEESGSDLVIVEEEVREEEPKKEKEREKENRKWRQGFDRLMKFLAESRNNQKIESESEFKERLEKLLEQILNKKEQKSEDKEKTKEEEDQHRQQRRRQSITEDILETTSSPAHLFTVDQSDFSRFLDLIRARDLRRKPIAYLNARFARNQVSRAIYAGVMTKKSVLDFPKKRQSVDSSDHLAAGQRKRVKKNILLVKKPFGGEEVDDWSEVLKELDFSSPLSQRIVGVLPKYQFRR